MHSIYVCIYIYKYYELHRYIQFGIPPTPKQKNIAAVTAAAATAAIPPGWGAGGHGLGRYVDIYRNV